MELSLVRTGSLVLAFAGILSFLRGLGPDEVLRDVFDNAADIVVSAAGNLGYVSLGDASKAELNDQQSSEELNLLGFGE
jgi:hypothetical protein